MSGKIFPRHLDRFLFCAPILIFLIGLLSVYSASFKSGQTLDQTLAVRQVLWMVLGLLLILLVIRKDYFRWQDWVWPLYGVSVLLLFWVLFSPPRHGARRWLEIAGISFQPSELAKLAVIFLLARFFSTRRPESISKRELCWPFVIVGIPFGLILKEPDLGSGLLLWPVLLAMLYGWGMRLKRLLFLMAGAIFASPFLFQGLKEYQQNRLLVFLNPSLDPLGAGYTVIQSKIAIGSGGFWGKGLLGGTQNRLHFLPERHTDFIFAVIGEEGGFLASAALLFVFWAIVRKGLEIARQTPDRFGSQLALGLSVLLGLQAVINLGMTMGLLPVVGVPLPLVSYGGSSVVMTMLVIGILLNIKIHRPFF